jgi:hypothetical protein
MWLILGYHSSNPWHSKPLLIFVLRLQIIGHVDRILKI